MQKHELPELAGRLAQLADALGGRAPSPAGLLVWLDALAECSMPDILAVLTEWPKRHHKMPLPAEVLAQARARLSERVESQAEKNRREAPSLADMIAGLRRNMSDEAKAAREQIADWLKSSGANGRNWRAWARELKAREEAGEPLSEVQREAWRTALRLTESDAEREARSEREAIVAAG